MSEVKAETKYGGSAKENRDGFGLTMTATVSEEQLAALAAIGLASIAYRGGASAINKALKVESNSVAEYSAESATLVGAALTEYAKTGVGFKVDGDNANPLGSGFGLEVEVSQHEHGTGGTEPGVMAKALWEQVKSTGGFAMIGAEEGNTDEEGVNLARKFLAGLKPPKAAKK